MFIVRILLGVKGCKVGVCHGFTGSQAFHVVQLEQVVQQVEGYGGDQVSVVIVDEGGPRFAGGSE